VIQAFIVKPYRIPSASMFPTLHINQRILVNRIGNHFGSPHLGDIVVFHPPQDVSACADSLQGMAAAGSPHGQPCGVAQRRPSSGVPFIKRIVGVPGDRLSIQDGHVIRNGVQERDSYTVPCAGFSACEFPRPVTVPRGDYYVMGDNRPDSEDSRYWGPVPKRWIIGQAFFTYWPLGRLGFL
jgi:signal peptidase I